jgi:predicted RNA-binding protein with PIN domain
MRERHDERSRAGKKEIVSRFPGFCRGVTFVTMSLVRILVDGYSFLHSSPQIAPAKPRYSTAARYELIRLLTQYADAVQTPITVFFDGAGAPAGTPKATSSRQMEILYASAGQTADDLIERAAHRLSAFGEVLVVTDDIAERDTVLS